MTGYARPTPQRRDVRDRGQLPAGMKFDLARTYDELAAALTESAD
jgi:hypothetical protein